jgi:hypothetical protein
MDTPEAKELLEEGFPPPADSPFAGVQNSDFENIVLMNIS